MALPMMASYEIGDRSRASPILDDSANASLLYFISLLTNKDINLSTS